MQMDQRMAKVRYILQVDNKAFMRRKKAMHCQGFRPVFHIMYGLITAFCSIDDYFTGMRFNQDDF